MPTAKRASMREGPLSQLFRKTDSGNDERKHLKTGARGLRLSVFLAVAEPV